MASQKREGEKKTTLQIPEDLHRRFKAVLAGRGLEMRAVLQQLVQDYVDRAHEQDRARQ
jgi:hypothetical protein